MNKVIGDLRKIPSDLDWNWSGLQLNFKNYLSDKINKNSEESGDTCFYILSSKKYKVLMRESV